MLPNQRERPLEALSDVDVHEGLNQHVTKVCRRVEEPPYNHYIPAMLPAYTRVILRAYRAHRARSWISSRVCGEIWRSLMALSLAQRADLHAPAGEPLVQVERLSRVIATRAQTVTILDDLTFAVPA